MPLSRFRVLQIGSCHIALDYCGKLFSDFGADVVKLEPPRGDPLRSFPPVLECRESGLFAWLNTNKRSVIQAPAALDALWSGADLLLDGRRLGVDAIHSGAGGTDQSTASWPGLGEQVQPTTTSISWFGEAGPYADFAATDCQSGIIAGLAAFIASAAGLYDRTSGSRRLSVSVHETVVNVAEYAAAVAWDTGASRKPLGVNRFARNYPVGIYSTKRGLIGVTIVTPAQWRGICAMLGMPELASKPKYAVNTDRPTYAHEIDAMFQPVWETRAATEWFELAPDYKLPMAVVPTMAELLEQQVHRARGAFVQVRIGEAAFEAPVLPQPT